MKRIASFALALVMLLSLAACGEDGLSLGPKEETTGDQYGYIGDTLSTEWFDFTVNDAYSCSEYDGYTPSAGYKLVVVTLSLKNTWGQSVDMWGDDFMLLWTVSEDDFDMDIPLPAGISDDQFPDEYVLGINASKSGVAVFEVPEEYRDFSLLFVEVFEDENDPNGREGDYFFVSFTPEEK